MGCAGLGMACVCLLWALNAPGRTAALPFAQFLGGVIQAAFLERDRDGHLRHDGRAAAPDEAPVGEDHRAAPARRLDRGVHAGAARSDHEHVGLQVLVLRHRDQRASA